MWLGELGTGVLDFRFIPILVKSIYNYIIYRRSARRTAAGEWSVLKSIRLRIESLGIELVRLFILRIQYRVW